MVIGDEFPRSLHHKVQDVS